MLPKILSYFCEDKKGREPQLEEKASQLADRALDDAEKWMKIDPVQTFNYLRQANELYDHLEDQVGLDLPRLFRLNVLSFEYIQRYDQPSKEDYDDIS